MTDNTTRSAKQILEGIEEALFDIGESLSEIAASTRNDHIDIPGELLDFGALHSDGGVNFATGTSTNIRTFGDPTVLSGDEEGLK